MGRGDRNHARYQVQVQHINSKEPLQPAHVRLLVNCGGHRIGQSDRAHGLCLDKRLQQQSHQFAARQVHRLSQMLLHDWKKFANFASVLGISSFLHLKNWKFFFAKSLILKGLCNSCVLDN